MLKFTTSLSNSSVKQGLAKQHVLLISNNNKYIIRNYKDAKQVNRLILQEVLKDENNKTEGMPTSKKEQPSASSARYINISSDSNQSTGFTNTSQNK